MNEPQHNAIELRITKQQYKTLYNILLNIAIKQMGKQNNIEGCKRIWGNYRKFQTNPKFIAKKEEMKQKLLNL